MKKQIAKQIVIGFLIGLVANVAGCYLYIYFFSEYSFEETLELAQQEGVLGNIISLVALLNLAVFFIFLKKKRYYRARGVLLATLAAAIFILITKFY